MNRFLLASMLALAASVDGDSQAAPPPGVGAELGAALSHVLGWTIEITDVQALDVVVAVSGSPWHVLADLLRKLDGWMPVPRSAAARKGPCVCRVLGADDLLQLVGSMPRLIVDATVDADQRLTGELDVRARRAGAVLVRPPGRGGGR